MDPVRVSAEGSEPTAVSGPTWMIVKHEFGRRGEFPPCVGLLVRRHRPLRAKTSPTSSRSTARCSPATTANWSSITARCRNYCPRRTYADFDQPEPFLPTWAETAHHQAVDRRLQDGQPHGQSVYLRRTVHRDRVAGQRRLPRRRSNRLGPLSRPRYQRAGGERVLEQRIPPGLGDLRDDAKSRSSSYCLPGFQIGPPVVELADFVSRRWRDGRGHDLLDLSPDDVADAPRRC